MGCHNFDTMQANEFKYYSKIKKTVIGIIKSISVYRFSNPSFL